MGRDYSKSERLFSEAQKYIAGGVNSPVRAFKAVGGNPVFFSRGEGALIFDVDGNEYIDYVASWGPLILGHAPPVLVRALKECAESGTSFGAPTELETELARLLVEALPAVEVVRLVNSGTEATMSALRLARAYAGREKIVKFAGCYHGHADALLVKAGSGALTLGVPTSPGVPQDTVGNTIVAEFNDLEGLRDLFARTGEEIAAVIVEPVPGNMGVVPPLPGFLDGLRDLTARYGALLIFDEVITGFRLAYGGAQTVYNVRPDLTCLGKIIGGGLPVGAYGGRREIMELVAPSGPVYQAGTLSGNPLAMAAGIATLKALAEPGTYEELERKSARLAAGLQQATVQAGGEVYFTRVGSMLCTFFQPGPVTDFTGAVRSDTGRYARYFRAMLERGVYIAPAQFEAMFVSTAHTDAQIDETVEKGAEALRFAFTG
ncbi:MAG: glutamate-1-semialdehyde 2,1-aminomutase [Candidatus Desulforudis sp.]|nr:glutamate-1-semialdehyde 2,1-aminomutase [Desulforudis sp.]